MGKHRRVVFVVTGVAIMAALAWTVFRRPATPEPVYEGLTLSVWLSNYTTNTSARPTTDNAIRHFGTNAIPLLVERLKAHDSPVKLQLIAIARKIPFVNVEHTDASVLQTQAIYGFISLGRDARSALPELIEAYENGISTTAATRTHESNPALIAFIFRSMGPLSRQAVPALLRGAVSTNSSVRSSANMALGEIHSDPELVVPVLIRSLKDPDFTVRRTAIEALHVYGPEAKAAVPALIGLVKENLQAAPSGGTNPVSQPLILRNAAMSALQRIDPEAADKADSELRRAAK